MKRVFIGSVIFLAVVVAGVYGWRWYLVKQFRTAVLAQLNDPDSALFRNEVVIGPWTPNGMAYCAEVNAKNRMGGYTGYEPIHIIYGFSFDIKNVIALNKSDFSEKLCKKWISSAEWWWMRW